MAKGRRWTSQLQRRREFTLPLPLWPVRALDRLYDAYVHWEGDLSYLPLSDLPLSLAAQILIFSRDILWTHLEIMFYQLSGHPLAQSGEHIKLTILFSQTIILLIPCKLIPTWHGIVYIKSDSHSINNSYMQRQTDLEPIKLRVPHLQLFLPRFWVGFYQRDNMIQSFLMFIRVANFSYSFY